MQWNFLTNKKKTNKEYKRLAGDYIDYIETTMNNEILNEVKIPDLNVKVLDMLRIEILRTTTPSLRDN